MRSSFSPNSNAERYEKEHYRIEEKTNERSG